jgi:hypothetical protein
MSPTFLETSTSKQQHELELKVRCVNSHTHMLQQQYTQSHKDGINGIKILCYLRSHVIEMKNSSAWPGTAASRQHGSLSVTSSAALAAFACCATAPMRTGSVNSTPQ